MNRTREAARARICLWIAVVLFLSAVASALVPRVGEYLALVLAMLGGLMMVASSIMRERSKVAHRAKIEPQLVEEQL